MRRWELCTDNQVQIHTVKGKRFMKIIGDGYHEYGLRIVLKIFWQTRIVIVQNLRNSTNYLGPCASADVTSQHWRGRFSTRLAWSHFQKRQELKKSNGQRTHMDWWNFSIFCSGKGIFVWNLWDLLGLTGFLWDPFISIIQNLFLLFV